MVQVEMTPDEFTAKAAQLKAEQGIDLSGSTGGQIAKSGVTAEWAYDGKTLTATLLKKPRLLTTNFCEGKLRDWLAGPIYHSPPL